MKQFAQKISAVLSIFTKNYQYFIKAAL